jgi:ribosomal protein S18 acetylase RimI-like enzyme
MPANSPVRQSWQINNPVDQQPMPRTPHSEALYFKRFRMELSLSATVVVPELPAGFAWWAWQSSLLPVHAMTKFECFVGERDSKLFPTLASLPACLELMKAIVERPTFCPQATWLIARKETVVGTVQGLAASRTGAIQNLGITRSFRGLGLGEILLQQTLHGFQAVGMRYVTLEVTATNDAAIKLYRRAGFRAVQTIYKELPVAPIGQEACAEPEMVGVGI